VVLIAKLVIITRHRYIEIGCLRTKRDDLNIKPVFLLCGHNRGKLLYLLFESCLVALLPAF